MIRKFIFVITILTSIHLSAQDFEPDTAVISDSDSTAEDATPRVRKYPARLWEVSGNGLKQPSYLYGTMHVSKKLAFNLGDTFYRALQAVDVVALELQIDSWLNNIGMNGAQQPISGFDKMEGYASGGRYGLYSSALEFHENTLRDVLGELNNYDYMSNYLLYRQGFQSPNYSEKTYVDMYIHQTGKKLGKYCTGLEDFELSRRMVDRSDWRERTLSRKGGGYGYYGYGYGEDPTETAYREGDLDLIDSFDKKSNPNKTYRKWMLYERNKVMADEFERITKNKRLFAAVGCAHLPGDSGVIEFLRRKGFTVKPVYDNVGDYAFKQKLKLEGISYPVTFSKYYSHSGELEFNLPGKPVDRSYENNEEIFYADVANGAYYVLKRLPWFGNMKGISRDKFLKQIDSALYENVPGDITDKERKTIGGNPALLISNRTKSGETQKHMFIVMQNHLWYIKLSATGNYAEGKEARDFFKSVNLKQDKTNWNYFEPESGGYRVYWPSNVVIKPYSFDTTTDYRGHINLEFTDEKNNYYFLNSFRMDNYNIDRDTFHMHQMALNYAFYHEGKLEKMEFKKINGHQAMTATVYLPKQKHHLHFLLAADQDVYYYLGTYTEDKNAPQDFLNKFSFVPFKYKYLPVKKKDPISGITYARPFWKQIEHDYKIQQEEKELKKKELRYPAVDYYSYSTYGFGDETDSFGALYRTARQILFPTGEQVNISMFKNASVGASTNYTDLRKQGILKGMQIDMKRYHFYYDSIKMAQKKEFQKKNKAKYYYHPEPYQSTDTLYWKGNLLYSESVEKSNFTARVNYGLNIVNEYYSVYISTSYDSSRGISPVVKSIVESVEPEMKQVPVLDSSAYAARMLGWLSSSDSIDLFHAQDNQYRISTIPKKFNDSLFSLLKKFDRNTDWGQDYASSLEQKLIEDKYDGLIGFYMDKFRRSGDTSETQAQMLSRLGTLKNRKAMDTLIYWLLEETPLAPENSYGTYSYNRIITTAYDSLRLWKDYYAKLLPLNRYREYGDGIMQLGLTLLDSNFIDSSIFKGMIPELALSFRDDLKRKMSRSTGNNYGYGSSSGSSRRYSYYLDEDQYEYGSDNNQLFRNTNGSYYSYETAGYEGDYSESEYGYLYGGNAASLAMKSINGGWATAPAMDYTSGGNNSSGLFDKARILAKFYHQDPEVAKRLNRVYQLKEKEEKMLYLDLFLKNKVSLPDTMFTHYLSKKDCEFGFVQMLKKRGLENKIPKNYFEEKNYATSFMYYHHFSEKDDSIVFLGKKAARVENENGNLYFWKTRGKEKNGEKSEELWQYSLVWIGAGDTLSKLNYPRYYKFNISMNKKYTVRDMMNNEAAELQYWRHAYWQQLIPKEEDRRVGIYDYGD